MWVGLLVGAGLLVTELAASDPAAMVRTLHPAWVAAALGATAVSMVAAAHNLRGFATVPLRTGQTLLAQLAIGFTRTFMPSAVTTPAVASRYLNRRGASWPAALGSVSAAQLAQLIVTMVIVGALSLTSSGAGSLHVQPQLIALVVAGIAALLGVAALIARRSAAVRRALAGTATSWATLRSHARQNPGRIAGGVVAAAALTATHILAFACCVYAVGGHGTLLALSIVYLGSSAAGSLIPTPGGTGAVETALIAGLTATGLPLPVAAAAALLSRLESVWLPALPGWWALRTMRRDGLL
jgi:uncharacterized membrane protein YbhN (UPF0104 family)